MFDVVAFSPQGHLPGLIHQVPVSGVDSGQKHLVGQRRPLGYSENPVGLVRPPQFVVPDVEPPAAGLRHGLRQLQVLPALAQFHIDSFAFGDVGKEHRQSVVGRVGADLEPGIEGGIESLEHPRRPLSQRLAVLQVEDGAGTLGKFLPHAAAEKLSPGPP
jgi:hypothetical protein